MENTSPKFFCFVLMPFTTDFDDIYNYGIKESCKDAVTYCERVDEQIFQETILERIYNQIAKADLIIADMTGRNPNVFYEVGYAHALNKPTILLTQNSEDIPFDLKHYPHIIYDKKISIIREELTKRLRWFKENKADNIKSFKTEIEIFVDDLNLSSGNVVHEFEYGYYPDFDITIHNNSPFTYQPGEFQIGIISEDFELSNTQEVNTTRLPGKKYLHMLPFFDLLLPGAYTSSHFTFNSYSYNKDQILQEFKTIIRIFSENGSRDYSLKLKRKENTKNIKEKPGI
jgi:nucleoside 2-deoxyribosyltransferase